MKLLWIGISTNDEMREELLRYKAKILSGTISEANLLAGFDANGVCIHTLNSYKYPAYPRGPLRVRRREWSRNGESEDISTGYLNLKYLNHISRKRALKKEIRAWAKSISEDEEVVVFVYSMHSPFMAAAKELKRYHKNTRIVLIVMDLPQYMDLHMSRVKKLLKAIDWKTICRLMKSVDKYVLYSKHMADFLKLEEGSWTVMEGSFDPSLIIDDAEVKKDSDKISVMYSGVLDTRYGIPELLDAFAELDNRFELWFTGTGNAVELINERAKSDPRIHNFGFLPSRRDLLIKQREATMLISTRRPDEPASAYCFPSKLFEYMVSGNPVLSCRIPGIPDEYFNYLIEMKSISPTDIKSAILGVADMSSEERVRIGTRSCEYILKEKNNNAQIAKVLKNI